VVPAFDGGRITSDGGEMRLATVERVQRAIDRLKPPRCVAFRCEKQHVASNDELRRQTDLG
jgi:hypothetical protein